MRASQLAHQKSTPTCAPRRPRSRTHWGRPPWQHGEVRATHRQAPRPTRDWRTRKDPFASVWPCVRAWLEAEPDRVGKELFARLQGELPGAFPDAQLRTFQRRVKEWRHAAARQLVFASPSEDAA